MPFPGIIKAGPPTRQISLSEAYKMSQALEVVFCHCKTTCNTKSCRCYSTSKLCSSRCHKHNTRQCSNYRPSPKKSDEAQLEQKYSFPVFGGGVNINGSELKLLNTCAVYTWISIFNVILTENELFLEKQSIYFEEHFKNLLQIIKRKDFSFAKWAIAEKNNIAQSSNIINFYGNEFTLVIRPFLQNIFTRHVLSKCSSEFCPVPEDAAKLTSIPTLNFSDLENVTESDFINDVRRWFQVEDITNCMRPFKKDLPDEEFIIWDHN